MIQPFSNVNVFTGCILIRDLLEIKIYLEEVIKWWCFMCLLATRMCVFVNDSSCGTVKGSGKTERKSSGQVGPLTHLNSLHGGRSPFL